ncbi:SpoIID/LytB domain-containing protein [Cellulomonas sp.]|uniref:SpoIID/LytB domain-containing protein n=1 Tax=Cellulomonas sp. TaxID=40001 RepID=UPI001B20D5DD|nr:SpoIID/LytB domain-containing protein [Cellulomonas sp.]MBO9556662.1 SpoIID/LytB domain-containing protein [Cellulomonas sp.]
MAVRRRLMAGVTLVLAAVLGVVVLPAPPAGAADVVGVPASGSWAVEGRGWGHGIGMSQWGAQGAALQGLSTAAILDFYYPGTTDFDIGQDYPLRVRLLSLAGGSAQLGPSTGSLVLTDLSTGARTTLPAGGRVVVTRTGGLFRATVDGAAVQIAGSAAFAGPMQVAGAQAAEVWAYAANGSARLYAGSLRLHATGASSLEVVNHVPMEQYLRGVVPQEVSSSWAPAALRAQAVAARSYALAVRSTSGTADLCDTTQCQVYAGLASRTAGGAVSAVTRASTDAAIVETARVARYYGGGPAFTQFSSTNGGYSKAGSRPYLVARADPYTGTAPGDGRTRWTDTLPVARVQQSCPSGGTLQRMTLTRDGNGDLGGRITSARLECSTGTATISTPAFGLLSSWWNPTSVNQPFGNFEVAQAAAGGVRVKGWAIDPDTAAAIDVRVRVGGAVTTVRADVRRDDVAAAYPSAGPLHGFDAVVPGASSGTACVTLVNVGVGSDTDLGCRTIASAGTPPFGSVDSITAVPGGDDRGPVVTVSGWAADGDAPQTALQVRVTVDGVVASTTTANGTRGDVAAALPGFGPAHGYAVALRSVAPGSREVCAQAVDTPTGVATSLGCRTVSVPGGPPFGNWEVATAVPGGVEIKGWMIDPDTTASGYVWVSVDGAGHPVPVRSTRADVAAAHPGYGSGRGFVQLVSAPPGRRTVCVTAVNVANGSDRPFGCRVVDVPGGSPVGNWEVAEGVSGGIQLTGWALDPDTTASPFVWVEVDGRGHHVRASVTRTDVGRVYPTYGNSFGFRELAQASSGRHTVCLTVDNVGAGTPTSLGCRQVVVP